MTLLSDLISVSLVGQTDGAREVTVLEIQPFPLTEETDNLMIVVPLQL